MRLVLFLSLLLLSFTHVVGNDTLRLMTYNIRLDTPVDGPNQWGLRSHKVVSLINHQAPDILGTQEALPNQIKDLADNLSGYNFVGVGRDDGKAAGEFSAIYFRKDKFQEIQSATFWLSKSPEIPGSKDWDAAITRICTWVKLKSKKSGKEFLVFNTHFDHIGKEARLNSVLLLRKKISEISGGLPFILMGDFNFQPIDAPYHEIVKPEVWPVYDSFTPQQEKACTFTGFSVNSEICNRIDYIFLSEHLKTLSFQIISDNDGEFYPSDHLPVMAMVNLRKLKRRELRF